ncbi:hypothetical protein T4E_5791 [Trichinella pseudospiralis]|uniref:Uncharacterized protein n=1 Tax=Trichinella pseudospiralis TaxID=6337 RepID=A0A0V1F9A9_TRIPS|nr:hypothetical protein T4E_5791 [Trichinella pseudospiralis]KRY82603.1 hypothetical protein T4D_9014 [Trichinella pseudospiralis]
MESKWRGSVLRKRKKKCTLDQQEQSLLLNTTDFVGRYCFCSAMPPSALTCMQPLFDLLCGDEIKFRNAHGRQLVSKQTVVPYLGRHAPRTR